MRYRRLGRTGLLVSELCLGTNTFGGTGQPWETLGALGQEDANAVIRAAVDAGITFIDTADIYAGGESEQRIGHAIRDLGLSRDSLVIATKAGGRTGPGQNDLGSSRAHLIAALEASLRRLGTDHVDIFMIHFPDPATPLDETLEALDTLVRSGKTRYVGCSNYPAWLARKALSISDHRGLARFAVMESHLSAASRELEEEVVPMAVDGGLGLLVWGPLLGGLLSGKYTRDGGGSGRTAGHVPPSVGADRLFGVVDVLVEIARRREATAAQVALAWTLARPAVTSVLFGARRPDQVAENARASEVTLTPADIAAIDAAGTPHESYAASVVGRSGAERMPYA